MGQVRKLPIICLNILIPLLRCKIFYLLFAGPVFLFVCVLLLFYLLHIPFLLLLTLSHVQFFATLWTLAYQSSLSFTISHSLLKLMSIESVMPSNHLILCPPALNLSQNQGLFQWVSSSHQVAKVLELKHQSFHWIFRVDIL